MDQSVNPVSAATAARPPALHAPRPVPRPAPRPATHPAPRPRSCPSRPPADSAGPAGIAPRPGAEVEARFVVRLVACALQADEAGIVANERGTIGVARARQIAMYLLHTSLSAPYGVVAAMFGRDRTTVSHACRTIEDLRDDPMHDDFIRRLEEVVELARSMSAGARRQPGPGPGPGPCSGMGPGACR